MTIETFRYDSADYLDTDGEVACFAEDFANDDDPALLEHTVGVVIRALGLNALANATGIPRRTLVEAVSGEGANRTETFKAILRAIVAGQLPQAAE